MVAAFVLAAPSLARMQGSLDLCGCASFPGLQPFDSTVSSTFPPGTTDSGTTITFTLPPDGILRFSSFRVVNRYIGFTRNALNTPVTILVAGNVTLQSTVGCCYYFVLNGSRGSNGNGEVAGVGGLGSNGGFRGGDGAQLGISGTSIGGAGFGPGGGGGGSPGSCSGSGGTFLGVPELLPLLGGSGGGGGCSTAPSPTSCSGGGGSGGGGAILIAANGTLSLIDYQIRAEGGFGGSQGNGTCSANGGSGSGGAIRLIANQLVQGGSAELFARAGEGNGSFGGTPGRVRLESIDGSALTAFTGGSPGAIRIVGPTPIANPLSPSVIITSVGGNATPVVPIGLSGGIDIVLATPGATSIDLATSGVPSGTTVEVTVKPRVGAVPISQTVPLTGCTGAGDCQATALFNLAAGSYVVEARATFQAQ
jgi:hypothetical protein